MSRKVGVIGPVDADDFADNIMHGLRSLGIDAVALGSALPERSRGFRGRLLNLAQKYVSPLDEHIQERMIRKAKQSDLEAIISVEAYLTPRAVRDLREVCERVILWFPDAVTSLGKQYMLLAPYSAIFTKEPHLSEKLYGILGLPVFYLPEACNSTWHKIDETIIEKDPVISVVGSLYPARALLLERLGQAGVPLQVHGSSVKAPRTVHYKYALSGGYVTRMEKARVFRKSAGVLNNLHPAEFRGTNCRMFEIAGSGGVGLTDSVATLPTLFEPGREVLGYESFDELVDLCRLVINNPKESFMIGDRASRRAHAEHTYESRLQEVLQKI